MKRLAALMLIPALATANPHACKTEHVAIKGKPAACDGVISPAQTALNGALCVDATLPRCRTLRHRDAAAAGRRVVLLASELTATQAQAKRWRELALQPAPSLPPKVIVRRVGLPGWATGVIAGAALMLGGWLGLKAAQ
jgi:hypothetical protein